MVQSSRHPAPVDDAPPSEDAVDAVDVVPAPDAPASTRAARIWLLLSATLVGVVHFTIADPTAGPRIFADEIGYLADARYMAGGHVIDMSHTAFYAAGFSLVITPFSRIFAQHPARLYESVILLQAVLAALSVVLIAHLCHWLFSARWNVAIIAALAAGLYPAFVINSGFTWSESMLTFALLVAISAVGWVLRTLDKEHVRQRALLVRSTLAGCACAYVITVHNRTILAMLVVVAILGAALIRRHAPRAAVFLGSGFVVVAFAGQVLNKHLNHVLWKGAGGVDASSDVFDLVHPHGMWLASRAAVGQYWYQFVATGGLLVIGLTALALAAIRQRRSTPVASIRATLASSRSTAAAAAFFAFVGLFVVSTIFLANGNRADTIVYGRYLDIATPLLVAAGIAWLGTLPSFRSLCVAAAAVAISSGGWLVLHFGARLELARKYNRAVTLGTLGWLDPHRGGLLLFAPTVWGVVIGLAAVAVSFGARRQHVPRGIATLVIAAGVVSLFSWQLSFAHPALLNSLGAGAAQTRATIGAINGTRSSELALDPTITVVDKLALEYWLPDMKIVPTTPAITPCFQVVSITRTAKAAPGQIAVKSGGAFHLFRGQRACAPDPSAG